ncbi:LLM class F420-dependent oxidoreductase [Actinophytocola sediminis]
MKLGLAHGYWGPGPPPDLAARIRVAEVLGYDSVWAAEAFGSDALTPLAWHGSRTSRIKLGTSIMQLSARTPAATAMAAMTMDHLTGGRFVLGLGASGPQVGEGWYGQSYPQPLARTREYVEILRRIIRRETAEFAGAHYQLPAADGTGPLRSTLRPLRADLPIYLAAEGHENVALAAEIADGWLAMMYSPWVEEPYREALAEGFSRRGARRSVLDFEVACRVHVAIDDDPEVAADRVRPALARHIGGLGSTTHRDVFARMGFAAECARVQDHYLAGREADAAAAVTLPMVERVALVGPPSKIADELTVWEESLVTTMLVSGDQATLTTIARLVGE